MAKVNRAQLETRLCNTVFALALRKNEESSAHNIYDTIHKSFPNRLKYVQIDGLVRLLVEGERSGGLVTVRRLPSELNVYALTPKFYATLVAHIIIATAIRPELLRETYSMRAGIMLLYERQIQNKQPPTMHSVFNLAREAH